MEICVELRWAEIVQEFCLCYNNCFMKKNTKAHFDFCKVIIDGARERWKLLLLLDALLIVQLDRASSDHRSVRRQFEHFEVLQSAIKNEYATGMARYRDAIAERHGENNIAISDPCVNVIVSLTWHDINLLKAAILRENKVLKGHEKWIIIMEGLCQAACLVEPMSLAHVVLVGVVSKVILKKSDNMIVSMLKESESAECVENNPLHAFAEFIASATSVAVAVVDSQSQQINSALPTATTTSPNISSASSASTFITDTPLAVDCVTLSPPAVSCHPVETVNIEKDDCLGPSPHDGRNSLSKPTSNSDNVMSSETDASGGCEPVSKRTHKHARSGEEAPALDPLDPDHHVANHHNCDLSTHAASERDIERGRARDSGWLLVNNSLFTISKKLDTIEQTLARIENQQVQLMIPSLSHSSGLLFANQHLRDFSTTEWSPKSAVAASTSTPTPPVISPPPTSTTHRPFSRIHSISLQNHLRRGPWCEPGQVVCVHADGVGIVTSTLSLIAVTVPETYLLSLDTPVSVLAPCLSQPVLPPNQARCVCCAVEGWFPVTLSLQNINRFRNGALNVFLCVNSDGVVDIWDEMSPFVRVFGLALRQETLFDDEGALQLFEGVKGVVTLISHSVESAALNVMQRQLECALDVGRRRV